MHATTTRLTPRSAIKEAGGGSDDARVRDSFHGAHSTDEYRIEMLGRKQGGGGVIDIGVRCFF